MTAYTAVPMYDRPRPQNNANRSMCPKYFINIVKRENKKNDFQRKYFENIL